MTKRDVRLDSLRGLFLVVMTIDHIGGKITNFTYQPLGFVSAAAAFVMLSGYLYAYTAPSTQPQVGALVRQSLTRAAKLYRYHLGTFALLLLMILVSPVHRDYLGNEILPAAMGPVTAMVYGAALLHQPTLTCLLPMYLILTLLSPLILMAFHHAYYVLVFVLSLALWGCGQFLDPHEWLTAISGTGAVPAYFNLLAWQLLWVAGLYIGYVHRVEKRTNVFLSKFYFWPAAVGATVFFLVRHGFIVMPDHFDIYFEKADVRGLRLVNIFCQVVVFCTVARLIPRNKGLPWLQFLGKYGLQVFCFHVLLVSFLKPINWRVAMHFGYTLEVAYLTAAVATLSIPALLYRAYEANMRSTGRRTWSSRISAVKSVVRGVLKQRRYPALERVD